MRPKREKWRTAQGTSLSAHTETYSSKKALGEDPLSHPGFPQEEDCLSLATAAPPPSLGLLVTFACDTQSF